ncbi:MAG: hypothetical protein JRH15_16315 [Deltaproteobacteria bacterium]|nr:hypothetical protein [Deltaproteobacteria bacterium]
MNKALHKNSSVPTRDQLISTLDPDFTYLVFDKIRGVKSADAQDDVSRLLKPFEKETFHRDIYEDNNSDVWLCIVKLTGHNSVGITNHVLKTLLPSCISCTVYDRRDLG